MDMGGRIKRARLAAELSMRELADKIGVSHTAISKYEHGEDTPRPSVLLRLAKELEVPTDYFFRKVELSQIINIADAEEAADQLRKEWELGFDPIVNVTSILEEHGIRVIMLLVSEGFDGFSCFANKTIPVILSQANIPGDRQIASQNYCPNYRMESTL